VLPHVWLIDIRSVTDADFCFFWSFDLPQSARINPRVAFFETAPLVR
jgi:hypothetical protein